MYIQHSLGTEMTPMALTFDGTLRSICSYNIELYRLLMLYVIIL